MPHAAPRRGCLSMTPRDLLPTREVLRCERPREATPSAVGSSALDQGVVRGCSGCGGTENPAAEDAGPTGASAHRGQDHSLRQQVTGTREAWTRSAERGARVCESVCWRRGGGEGVAVRESESEREREREAKRERETEGWQDVRAVSDLDLLSTRRAASSRWPSPLALPAAVYIPHPL